MKQVSIVIPHFSSPDYRRSHFLLEAINSCLDGNDLDLEIIVVDDDSDDEPPSELGAYDSVRYIRLPVRGGPRVARNQGLISASGQYVKFLDSDDVLESGVLAREFSAAEAEGADMVVSGWGICVIDEGGKVIPGTQQTYPAPVMEPVLDSVLAGKAVPTSAALYNREYIKDLRWDPTITRLDDWDWFCTAAMRGGKFVTVPWLSYWWRHHQGSQLSKVTLLENAHDFYRILNKLEEYLQVHGELSEKRKQRLAQYYYKELRILSRFDQTGFEKILTHIFELDSAFIPVDEERSKLIRSACGLIGVRKTLLLYGLVKRLTDSLNR